MKELFHIVISVVAPIFVLVGAGAYLERRFRLDIATLAKINFYVFVPALIFTAIVKSEIDWEGMAIVALFQVVIIFALLVLNVGVTRLTRLPAGLSAAFLMGTVFCNSGNFGLPLVRLAFPESPSMAVSYQAIQVMVQNFLTFTLGLVIVRRGRAALGEALRGTLRLPFVYVIASALIIKRFDIPITRWPIIWEPLSRAGDGLIAVALITLGVQIAKTPRVPHRAALGVATFMRLAVAPAVAFILVKAFGLTGMVSRLLVIGAAAPAAVNTVLIGIEFDNEPDFAASVVFYTTLFSAITVAITIFVVRTLM